MEVDDLKPYGLCGQADRVTKIRVRESDRMERSFWL